MNQSHDSTKIVKSDEELKNFSINVSDVSNSNGGPHQFIIKIKKSF